MTRVHGRGENIRSFIIRNVEAHATDIAKVAADHFGVTRQAISRHLQKLTMEGCLTDTGNTRGKQYKLVSTTVWRHSYPIVAGIAEDMVWKNDIRSALGRLPDNVMNIWNHGFTEMFNNAIDHSGGSSISVEIRKTAASAEMAIFDDGVGIFRKIQNALGLVDERQALLELAKGKFTTDPKNHAGEGIFFTSRMFDSFQILSGGIYFSHQFDKAEDWVLEREEARSGTAVWMTLNNHTSRTTKKIFDKYSSEDEDYGFTKTVVPVRLAQYGDDKLVSRSQAKRLLARIELFKKVVLEFTEVSEIGQAFADEIFRVFASNHPEIELVVMDANTDVKRMIARVKSGKLESVLPKDEKQPN
jgi:anti-sigma regulatory factor (Ser/Thr protein kinase)